MNNTNVIPPEGSWEVRLTSGKTYCYTDIPRISKPPWVSLKDQVKADGDKIESLKVYIGNLVSECPVKNAPAYYLGRSAWAFLPGVQGNMIGHGYVNEEGSVTITWCGANGYSKREVRPREACEEWLI